MQKLKVRNLKLQRGAALLLELAIVTIISTAMIATSLIYERDKVLDQQFSAQGDLMNTLKGAVSTYIANNYQALVNGSPIAGVANPYAPTIAELQNAAVSPLPSGFNATSMFGFPYVVSIARTPAGCVAPACDVTGIAYINGAPINAANGKVAGARLGVALNQIGGDGAVSDSMAPNTLYGMGGQFALPNPAGNTPGILAVRTGFGSSAFAQFLRRDGSLPMTGNLKMGNQDITGAGGAFFAGGTNAKSVNVGNAVFYGDTGNAAIRTNGALYVQNAAGSAAADFVANTVYGLNAVVSSGDVNAARDLNAQRDARIAGSVYAKSGQFSLDGAGTCCNPNAPTLAVSEATNTTGRLPTIQFHSGGVNEGYITISSSGSKRFLLRDNQGGGMGLDADGPVYAKSVKLPSGQNLQIGNGYYFGDESNLALRPNGGDVYFQRTNGGVSSIAQIGNINASGNLNSTGGVVNISTDYWSILGRNAAGQDNSQAQSAIGSGYFNDIFIRSIGKWASQLAAADSLGVNQSWGDYTGARGSGGAYGNNTGRAIGVNISVTSNTGGQIVATLYINGVTVGNYNSYNQRYNNGGNFSVVVPPNATYQMNLSGDHPVISNWSELR